MSPHPAAPRTEGTAHTGPHNFLKEEEGPELQAATIQPGPLRPDTLHRSSPSSENLRGSPVCVNTTVPRAAPEEKGGRFHLSEQ